jgi:hypothetical protein
VVATRIGAGRWYSGATKPIREAAFASEDWDEATLDHVIPRSCGGTNKVSNLLTCCMRCNRARANRSADVFAVELSEAQITESEIAFRVLQAMCSPLP